MKILIVTKNWLGDILFEIPAIEMIRAHYPESKIFVLAHPRCQEILKDLPSVDHVITFDEQKSSFVEKIRLIHSLRKEKIDTAYFFHRSRTRAFLLMLSGVKQRIGYGLKKLNFLTQALAEPEKPLHHVDYFVELLKKSGFSAPLAEPAYQFYFSNQDKKNAQRLLDEHKLSRFACFHLGANWEPKRWPAGHFANLAEGLQTRWNLPVVLTGGSGDQGLGEEVLRQARSEQIISLIGRTSLGELGAIFSQAQFVISGDSGPMHIASGVGARVLALFGPTDPKLTGPRGIGETLILSFVPQGYQAPWYGENFPSEGWLSQILPSRVLEALEAKNWNKPKEKELFPGISPEKKVSTGYKKEQRILVNTLSNIGDVILTTPVMMALAKHYPQNPMTVLVGPRAKGVLEGSCVIDELVVYDKHVNLFEKLKMILRLRKKRYEVVVDLKNSAIPFLIHAKKRSPLIRVFKKNSARDRHLEILEKMGLSTENLTLFDFYHDQEKQSVLEKLRALGCSVENYVVVAPVAASEIKTWPLLYYQKVIEGILSETSLNIILAGGPREESLVAPLVALDSSRIFNMAGQTSLRQLAALIDQSELLLANDSSAAQLSFEMNHPTVVIFGPTDPEKFARKGKAFRILTREVACRPCGFSKCHQARQSCLLDLEPETVLQACRDLLSLGKVRVVYSENRVKS